MIIIWIDKKGKMRNVQLRVDDKVCDFLSKVSNSTEYPTNRFMFFAKMM